MRSDRVQSGRAALFDRLSRYDALRTELTIKLFERSIRDR